MKREGLGWKGATLSARAGLESVCGGYRDSPSRVYQEDVSQRLTCHCLISKVRKQMLIG